MAHHDVFNTGNTLKSMSLVQNLANTKVREQQQLIERNDSKISSDINE